MRNKLLYLLISFCVAASAHAHPALKMHSEVLFNKWQKKINTNVLKDSAVIKVKLKNPRNYLVYFMYNTGGKWIVDSTYVVQHGYNVYTLPVLQSAIISLVIRNTDMDISVKDELTPLPMIPLYLKEGAVLTVEGDAGDPLAVSVKSGNQDIRDFEIYRSAYQEKNKERWELLKKTRLNTDQNLSEDTLQAKMRKVSSDIDILRKEFVKKYEGTNAALEVFNMYYTTMENDEAIAVFNTFPDSIKKTGTGIKIGSMLESVSKSSSGQMVIPFAQKGIDSKMVDIAAQKGKIVLIDFWGSWCGPCRQSHPHLKEVYKKYKKRGLEIVGVASEYGDKEQQKKAWKDAVKQDGINWLQVLNGDEQQDLVKLYGVTGFPTKVLVDRNGKIVLRYMGDEADLLDKKLNEFFP